MDVKVLVVGLVAGLLVGAGVGYSIVQSQTGSLQAQVTQLNTDKTSLQNQVTTLQNQLATKTGEVNTLNTQISSLQTQIATKNSQIATLQSQAATKDIEINDLESQIADLQSQLIELQTIVPPIIKGEWQTLATFTGRGDYTTDYFFIPEIEGVELRINWTNYASNSDEWVHWLNLYKKGGAWNYESLLVPKTKTGTWLIHPPLESGYNYLEIDTWIYQNSVWSVTIEIFIPE